jgi:hypothetical protein
LGHTEYCSNDALKRALNVRGARLGPAEQTFGKAALVDDRPLFEDVWEIDLIWSTNDGPVPWSRRGRVTDMGHADFLEGGVDRRLPQPCPFADADEVLAFDAVKEYGLPDFPELVKYYEHTWQKGQAAFPNQVLTAGYYKTIISGAIEAFGWDKLLLGAAEPDRFERVLDSFYRLTRHHVEAWAQTSAPVFIQHDDFVWSEGPFLNPEFYRRVIIPRYAALWKILRAAGKKVLFCSDAQWTMFVEDIAAAGADGFIFEPMVSLEHVVKQFGKTHVIVGSKVDTRTLTFGTKDDIRREVDATLALAMDCPGFMVAVGNHIPSNVPVANAQFYFDYLRDHWRR